MFTLSTPASEGSSTFGSAAKVAIRSTWHTVSLETDPAGMRAGQRTMNGTR